MKRAEIFDVALAGLGFGVALVLGDDVVDVPASNLSDNSDDASSSVLAMVAVDQERVVLLVENDAEDRLHRLEGDGLLLGALHVENHLSDAFLSNKHLEVVVKLFLLDKGAAKG